MTHTKPILAMSLLGAGVAALVVGFHVQRDRFAFTTKPALDSAASASEGRRSPTKATAAELAASPRHPAFHSATRNDRESEIPTVTIEALPVMPLNAPARQSKPASGEDSVELQNSPCNPKWRSLESGPIGRIYRDICPAPGSVPRS